MMEIAVLSAAFAMGAAIPDRHAGADGSPPLSWSDVPANTQSIAILCDDSDAPVGDWVHWVLFNLAPETRSLPGNVARDAQLPGMAIQGLNDYNRVGYDGPWPPPGQTHRYQFKVFALDTRLSLDSTARKKDLLRAMQGHLLAQGALSGSYARKSQMTNSFDERAQTWDDDPRRVKQTADIFAALERQVPLRPDMAALDYGCGTGLLTLALAPRVRRVVAVDSSKGMLDVLGQKAQAAGLGNLTLLQSDFAADPPPPGPCDLITSAMTLHHVADVAALLQTFFPLLAPGGFLALADLDQEDGSFHAHSDGIPHCGFDRDAFSTLLAAAGFEDIQFATAARIEKNARAYSIFLATARKP